MNLGQEWAPLVPLLSDSPKKSVRNPKASGHAALPRFIEQIQTDVDGGKAAQEAYSATTEDSPMKDIKWTDIVMAVFTVVIAGAAILQWREMVGSGGQTDKLLAYAKVQANAASDIGDAAQQFSDTANDTNDRISEAVDQLKAAAENARTTIRNAQSAFQQEQRAWVGLGQYRIDNFDDKNPFKLALPWINSGKTPAVRTETGIAYILSPSRLTGPPEHKHIFEKASAIAPQGIYVDTVTNLAIPPAFAAINDGTLWMYFFGQFRYHDVHSPATHTTSFCLFYDRTLKQMAFCESGNDMD